MIFQLSEVEYRIIDSLADGPEPLQYLLRALQADVHNQQNVEMITILSELIDKHLARRTRFVGCSAINNPLKSLLREDASHLPTLLAEHDYWFELTDGGVTAWQIWRQARQG